MKKITVLILTISLILPIFNLQTYGLIENPTGIKITYKPLNMQEQKKIRFDYNADKIEVAVTPDHAYELIRKIIQSANNSIYIEIYQFWSEDIFQLINQTLRNKPSIKVRILIENDTGYRGSISGPDLYNRFYANKFYQLKNKGYDVQVRLEPSWYYYHGKIIIVDNKTILISSDNFVPTAFPSNPNSIEKIEYKTPSRGWVAKIDDETVVNFYLSIFNGDFGNGVSYNPVRDGTGEAPPDYGQLSYSVHFGESIIAENIPVLPVASPINSNQSLVDLLLSANHTIIIEQIYIYESAWYLVDILKKVHDEKGVTVMIILEDDYPGTYNDIKDNLTALGFHVLPGFDNIGDSIYLHNKGIIVDDRIVFVGSINWSGGSVNSNREYGVIIDSRSIASFLRKVYAFDWNSSLVQGFEVFDSDGDGLPNYYEIEHNLDKNDPDTDDDGLSDYEEVYVLGTDPTKPNFVSSKVFTIYSPNNNSYYNKTDIELSVKVNSSVVDEIKLYLNNNLMYDFTGFSGGWINGTIIANEGVNNLVLIAYNSSNTVIDEVSILFTVDTTPPIVRIVKPFNNTIFGVTENISLEWVVTETNPYKSIIYLDDKHFDETSGTKINISIFENKIRSGIHSLKVIALDLAGNKGFATVTFEVSKPYTKIISLNPPNNTKVYEEELTISVKIESMNVEIRNVTIQNGGFEYSLQEEGRSGDVYTFSGRIKIIQDTSIIKIGTDFYVFSYRLVLNVERNVIIRTLYEYRYEIAAIIILLVIALIRYKLKRR